MPLQAEGGRRGGIALVSALGWCAPGVMTQSGRSKRHVDARRTHPLTVMSRDQGEGQLHTPRTTRQMDAERSRASGRTDST
jgi:hypothetical protein